MERRERDRNANEEDDEKDTNTSKLDLDSLPLDLKMVILTRLPAKSLTKLRCVSKKWYSIIRSRRFVDSFFTMSSKHSRFIVALSNGVLNQPKKRCTFFFSFSHEGEESSSLVPYFEMAMPTSTYNFDFGCCTSSHGFLAVQPDGHRVMLCNPSTKQVIKLPTNSKFVGLGYDPIGGQHKVLFINLEFPYDGDSHLVHEVLTLGGGEGWRNIKDTPVPYRFISSTSTMSVCINGVLYYGGYCLTETKDPVVVCFDVRSEKLNFIKAPEAIVVDGIESIFIEYKGKLAFIVRKYDGHFDLWILEDPEKHEWSGSKERFVCPSVWDPVSCGRMCFPGTNKAGEIIMAPSLLSRNVQPFYIFYYNVETKNIRRVRLLGIGDDAEFRRSNGFVGGPFNVRIAPQHAESIAFV